MSENSSKRPTYFHCSFNWALLLGGNLTSLEWQSSISSNFCLLQCAFEDPKLLFLLGERPRDVLASFCLGAQWSLWLWVRAVCQSLISRSANSGDLRFNPPARWATGSITTLCFECLFIFHNEPKHSPSAFIDISVPKSISAASLPHKHSSGLMGRKKEKKLEKEDKAL